MPAVSTEILSFLTFSDSSGVAGGGGIMFNSSSGQLTLAAIYAAIGRIDYLDITLTQSGGNASEGCFMEWRTGAVYNNTTQSGGKFFSSNPLTRMPTDGTPTVIRVPNNVNQGVGDQLGLARLFFSGGSPGGGSGFKVLTSVLAWNDPPPPPVVPFWSSRINCTEI